MSEISRENIRLKEENEPLKRQSMNDETSPIHDGNTSFEFHAKARRRKYKSTKVWSLFIYAM